MNIDSKILKKNEQTEYSNTSERPYIMIKWDLFLGCKVGTISANQLM